MLDKNTIYQGDCLEVMADIADGSIDMILCDLPYGTTACKWDTVIPFDLLWSHYRRIIKDRGAVVLSGSEPFSSLLRLSNLECFKYDWIWDKVRPSGFQIAKYVPMKRHEIISVFCFSSLFWNPQKEHINTPYKGRVCSSSDSSPLKYSDGKTRTYCEKNPQSILKFYKKDFNKYMHPTQKPVALFEYLIRTYTNPGETVLDNCAGSGTTGLACINSSRDFILIEQHEEYCEVARERMALWNIPVVSRKAVAA